MRTLIPAANDNSQEHVYRDVTAADFELLEGSPAASRGTSTGPFPQVDFYGNPRAQSFSLGAIEPSGSSSAMLPAAHGPVLSPGIPIYMKELNGFTDHFDFFTPGGKKVRTDHGHNPGP